MDCKEINFVQSQHFYGLAIAKRYELPPINAGDETWLHCLKRLNHLANLSAKDQIEQNKQEPPNG